MRIAATFTLVSTTQNRLFWSRSERVFDFELLQIRPIRTFYSFPPNVYPLEAIVQVVSEYGEDTTGWSILTIMDFVYPDNGVFGELHFLDMVAARQGPYLVGGGELF